MHGICIAAWITGPVDLACVQAIALYGSVVLRLSPSLSGCLCLFKPWSCAARTLLLLSSVADAIHATELSKGRVPAAHLHESKDTSSPAQVGTWADPSYRVSFAHFRSAQAV